VCVCTNARDTERVSDYMCVCVCVCARTCVYVCIRVCVQICFSIICLVWRKKLVKMSIKFVLATLQHTRLHNQIRVKRPLFCMVRLQKIL